MYSSFLAGPLEVFDQHLRLRVVFPQSRHGLSLGNSLAERICRALLFEEGDPGVPGLYLPYLGAAMQATIILTTINLALRWASYDDGVWRVMKVAIGNSALVEDQLGGALTKEFGLLRIAG